MVDKKQKKKNSEGGNNNNINIIERRFNLNEI